MPPVVFKKPPLVEVGVSVQFPNNLGVAESRNAFHHTIRAEFPQVVIPEQSKQQFDFGDYSLYTENLADRLDIGMNYFRYVTTSYAGYPRFSSLFKSSLSIFSKTYGIDAFSDFFYYYNNRLPIEGQMTFDECFTLDVHVPGNLKERYYSGQGTLLFREQEGFVAVELSPEWKDTNIVAYSLSLRFGAHRQMNFRTEDDEISPLVDTGHDHIETYFLSLLQPQYLKFLQDR